MLSMLIYAMSPTIYSWTSTTIALMLARAALIATTTFESNSVSEFVLSKAEGLLHLPAKYAKHLRKSSAWRTLWATWINLTAFGIISSWLLVSACNKVLDRWEM